MFIFKKMSIEQNVLHLSNPHEILYTYNCMFKCNVLYNSFFSANVDYLPLCLWIYLHNKHK